MGRLLWGQFLDRDDMKWIDLSDRLVLGDHQNLSGRDRHEVRVDDRNAGAIAQSKDKRIRVTVDAFAYELAIHVIQE